MLSLFGVTVQVLLALSSSFPMTPMAKYMYMYILRYSAYMYMYMCLSMYLSVCVHMCGYESE